MKDYCSAFRYIEKAKEKEPENKSLDELLEQCEKLMLTSNKIVDLYKLLGIKKYGSVRKMKQIIIRKIKKITSGPSESNDFSRLNDLKLAVKVLLPSDLREKYDEDNLNKSDVRERERERVGAYLAYIR